MYFRNGVLQLSWQIVQSGLRIFAVEVVRSLAVSSSSLGRALMPVRVLPRFSRRLTDDVGQSVYLGAPRGCGFSAVCWPLTGLWRQRGREGRGGGEWGEKETETAWLSSKSTAVHYGLYIHNISVKLKLDLLTIAQGFGVGFLSVISQGLGSIRCLAHFNLQWKSIKETSQKNWT